MRVRDEMHAKQLLTVAVAVVVALSIVGPAAAADGLDVSVGQDGDDVKVTVTANNSSVENATVTVDDGNATYDEAGNYTTDDDGLVELSAPDENVTVAVTADADNESASTEADLIAESIAENETDETEGNETDEAEGNETDEAGGPFDIDLGVTVDNGTVDYSNTTVNDSNPFGLYVSSFVHTVRGENVSGPMGQTVASFVTAFNPGQGPPEHAGPSENSTQGPPEDAGPSENSTQGPPEDAGPSENSTQGPPEDAGPSENSTQGPPEDAGPSENSTQGPPEDA
ncbi:MAG: proline-rich domain-containing protein, partial [Halapricum sp.]